MINLLSNAVKFTQEGGVTVRLKEKGNMVQITVKDTGIGIKPEDIDKMFTEFCTIPSHQRFNPNGTGLGLYLSKNFAQLMNGTITLKSTYGVGSKFVVRIPLSEEPPSEEEEEEMQEDVSPIMIPEGLSKFVFTKAMSKEELINNLEELKLPTSNSDESKNHGTVLIVDDNPMNSLVISKMLNRFSLNSEEALNGKEAVELVQTRKSPYCLILMDVNMPVMSGPEVLCIATLGCEHTEAGNE